MPYVREEYYDLDDPRIPWKEDPMAAPEYDPAASERDLLLSKSLFNKSFINDLTNIDNIGELLNETQKEYHFPPIEYSVDGGSTYLFDTRFRLEQQEGNDSDLKTGKGGISVLWISVSRDIGDEEWEKKLEVYKVCMYHSRERGVFLMVSWSKEGEDFYFYSIDNESYFISNYKDKPTPKTGNWEQDGTFIVGIKDALQPDSIYSVFNILDAKIREYEKKPQM